MEDNSLVKYLIGAARVKFDVLDQLYAPFNVSKYRMMVMFVDAHSIFYRLYREKNIAQLYQDDMSSLVRDLVVGFFNVLGHYRRYMAKRLQRDNDIFVTFNRQLPKYCEELCPEYNENLYKRYSTSDPNYGFVNKAMDEAWAFILALSPYFEGIYCVRDAGVSDFAIMRNFEKDVFYTIFSRNMFSTQLLADNVVQLYNKRDDSYLITLGSCYENGVLKGCKTKANSKLTPDMLPLLWSLAGCSGVSIQHVPYCRGIADVVKSANLMVDQGELVPGMSIQSFLERLPIYMTKKGLQIKTDKQRLIRRYKVLSLPLQSVAITADQEIKIKSSFYDIYDENELESLNEIIAQGGVDPELLELENLNMSEAVRYE